MRIDSLGRAAVSIAMTAAVAYALRQGLTRDQLRDAVDDLTAYLRKHVHQALDQALEDARQALEANMPNQAEATFQASMALAGVAALNEWRSHEEER